MNKNRIILHCVSLGLVLSLTGCSGMLDTDSNLVEFAEDNTLDSPEDSVYSVMGIIYKMQKIADRTVLLGELRGDLLTPTTNASSDLKAISNFEITTENSYNEISDYYSVINNCNYFLANVDTALEKRNQKVFQAEYAAVKAFRAWTYLEAAKVYGSLPLITSPILDETEAKEAMNQTPSSIADICNYFIDDISPYVDYDLPNYGTVSSQDSRKFFVPVRVLLGDLCLWAGRYQEAAQYYHDFLTKDGDEVTTGTNRIAWSSNSSKFENITNGYSSSVQSGTSSECESYIPMESNEFNGVYSDLSNIYNSTSENNYYFQVVPSQAMKNLSASQKYCMEYKVSDTRRDTLYAPTTNLDSYLQAGDLRLYANYNTNVVNQDLYSKYSADRQTINKINSNGVTRYRTQEIYLHFAEALNRAGFPQSAFCILKYGLYKDMMEAHIDSTERAEAGNLLTFDETVFNENNTQGVHSRGSGDSPANKYYTLPEPSSQLTSRADTVSYQIPLVEDLIVNEMALETSFEGQRYYDLMRIALRRNDPSYLAEPISKRNGEQDATLYQLLLDEGNWYLPKN